MPPRPLACCTAVQRRVRAQPDAIWITEDILAKSFQRFCIVIRSFRRDGSSVPGPLESRRRLGKRRMANLAEAIKTPSLDFGAIWGFRGDSNRDQWQWKAPQKAQPTPRDEITVRFPSWLNDIAPTPSYDLPITFKPDKISTTTYETLSIAAEDDIHIFRKSLTASPADEVKTLCESFNTCLKQSITLGLISMNVIASSLHNITSDIQCLHIHKEVMESLRLSFYVAVWDGIKACKVLRSVDLGGEVPNTLLYLLAQLSANRSIQALAIEIIKAETLGKITDIMQEILYLVKAWVSSWIDLKPYMSDKTVQSEHGDKYAFWSLEQSVAAIAEILALLPRDLAYQVIHTCTDYLIEDCFAKFVGSMKVLRQLRYSWLSTVASTPCVDESLLIKIWTKMDFDHSEARDCTAYTPNIPRLTMREGCRLLLDFWISHEQIKAAKSIRSTFETAIKQSEHPDDVACLLLAIDEHKDNCWEKTRSLFRFLRGVKKPQAVYYTLRLLRDHNIRIPASLIATEVRDMSRVDVRCALNIYKLYHTIRHDNTPLLLDGCSELVIAMIHSDQFSPVDIWKLLEIPLYDPRRLSLSSKSLTKARIRLIHEIAFEFAQAECRTHRVALRNVMQCAMYLRRHRVPLSTDISRSFSYAGIIRELRRRHWIGTKKALWILDLTRQAEGDAVAGDIEKTMTQWRSAHVEQQQHVRRERNPLRVSIID